MKEYEDMFIQCGRKRAWIIGTPEQFTIRYKDKFIDETHTFVNRPTMCAMIESRVGDINMVKDLIKFCKESVVGRKS